MERSVINAAACEWWRKGGESLPAFLPFPEFSCAGLLYNNDLICPTLVDSHTERCHIVVARTDSKRITVGFDSRQSVMPSVKLWPSHPMMMMMMTVAAAAAAAGVIDL